LRLFEVVGMSFLNLGRNQKAEAKRKKFLEKSEATRNVKKSEK